MAEIRQVTDLFAVAPQLDASDFAAVAAAGFKSVINNRPDGEGADQLASAGAEAQAKAHGLAYRTIPFAGPPTPAQIDATLEALKDLPGPVLAYCRTGTRSITVWAMAQARGGRSADEIVTLARAAGYDLAPHRETLRRLGAG